MVGLAGPGPPLPPPALGRPAAAGGPGPGAGRRAAGGPARRAVLLARRRPCGPRVRADVREVLRAAGTTARARHPRPGRGAVAGRPGGRHRGGPDRPGRRRPQTSTRAPPTRSWPASSARPTWSVGSFEATGGAHRLGVHRSRPTRSRAHRRGTATLVLRPARAARAVGGSPRTATCGRRSLDVRVLRPRRGGAGGPRGRRAAIPVLVARVPAASRSAPGGRVGLVARGAVRAWAGPADRGGRRTPESDPARQRSPRRNYHRCRPGAATIGGNTVGGGGGRDGTGRETTPTR